MTTLFTGLALALAPLAASVGTAAPAANAGKKAAGADAFARVDAVLGAYRAAPAIKAKVKKSVSNAILGPQGESKGDFYFRKGKLRLEFTEPDKTTLVYDGRFVWMESALDPKSVQVTKIRTVDLRRSKSVLTALFERQDVLRGFKLARTSGAKDAPTYHFVPKSKNPQDDIQALDITLAKKELKRVAYTDGMENEVTFEFSDVKTGEVGSDKFSYKPPKGAAVTEI